jgi:hypothetical protein
MAGESWAMADGWGRAGTKAGGEAGKKLGRWQFARGSSGDDGWWAGLNEDDGSSWVSRSGDDGSSEENGGDDGRLYDRGAAAMMAGGNGDDSRLMRLGGAMADMWGEAGTRAGGRGRSGDDGSLQRVRAGTMAVG